MLSVVTKMSQINCLDADQSIANMDVKSGPGGTHPGEGPGSDRSGFGPCDSTTMRKELDEWYWIAALYEYEARTSSWCR